MKKPSALIQQHIEGTGNGYELDDLLSCAKGPWQEQVSKAISEITEQYRTTEFPLGISNPASFEKLRKLADDLALRGY